MSEELTQRWREGDDQAGRALVEAHLPGVLRFFQNKAGVHAEDLTQETFVRCAAARERFAGHSSFRTFVFGIARHVLYEHYRRHQAASARELNFGVSSAVDLDPTPSQLVAAAGRQQRLRSELRHLPVDLQIALELFYWEGLSIAEMAESLEIPTGTVKRRLMRGREALRRRLGEEMAAAQ